MCAKQQRQPVAVRSLAAPTPQPTMARAKLPPAEPGPAVASGPLLLALSPNPAKPKTKWKVSRQRGKQATKSSSKQSRPASMSIWKQQGAGSWWKISHFTQAVGSKGSKKS